MDLVTIVAELQQLNDRVDAYHNGQLELDFTLQDTLILVMGLLNDVKVLMLDRDWSTIPQYVWDAVEDGLLHVLHMQEQQTEEEEIRIQLGRTGLVSVASSHGRKEELEAAARKKELETIKKRKGKVTEAKEREEKHETHKKHRPRHAYEELTKASFQSMMPTVSGIVSSFLFATEWKTGLTGLSKSVQFNEVDLWLNEFEKENECRVGPDPGDVVIGFNTLQSSKQLSFSHWIKQGNIFQEDWTDDGRARFAAHVITGKDDKYAKLIVIPWKDMYSDSGLDYVFPHYADGTFPTLRVETVFRQFYSEIITKHSHVQDQLEEKRVRSKTSARRGPESRKDPTTVKLLEAFDIFVKVEQYVGTCKTPILFTDAVQKKLAIIGERIYTDQVSSNTMAAKIPDPEARQKWTVAIALGWVDPTSIATHVLKPINQVVFDSLAKTMSIARLRKIYQSGTDRDDIPNHLQSDNDNEYVTWMKINKDYVQFLAQTHLDETDYPPTIWYRDAGTGMDNTILPLLPFVPDLTEMIVGEEIPNFLPVNGRVVRLFFTLDEWMDWQNLPVAFVVNKGLVMCLKRLGIRDWIKASDVIPYGKWKALFQAIPHRMHDYDKQLTELEVQVREKQSNPRFTFSVKERRDRILMFMADEYERILTMDKVLPIMIFKQWDLIVLEAWLNKKWDWYGKDGKCVLDPRLGSEWFKTYSFANLTNPSRFFKRETLQQVMSCIHHFEKIRGIEEAKTIVPSPVETMFIDEMKLVGRILLFSTDVHVWTHRYEMRYRGVFMPMFLRLWYFHAIRPIPALESVDQERERKRLQTTIPDSAKNLLSYTAYAEYIVPDYVADLETFASRREQKETPEEMELCCHFIMDLLSAMSGMVALFVPQEIPMYSKTEFLYRPILSETIDNWKLLTKDLPSKEKILLFWFHCITNRHMYSLLKRIHVFMFRGDSHAWDVFLCVLFYRSLSWKGFPIMDEYEVMAFLNVFPASESLVKFSWYQLLAETKTWSPRIRTMATNIIATQVVLTTDAVAFWEEISRKVFGHDMTNLTEIEKVSVKEYFDSASPQNRFMGATLELINENKIEPVDIPDKRADIPFSPPPWALPASNLVSIDVNWTPGSLTTSVLNEMEPVVVLDEDDEEEED